MRKITIRSNSLNVVTALRTIFPAWGEDLLGLLTAPSRPPFPVIGLTVINELDVLEQEFVLVLDDYHVVTDPVIHEWLARLAAHPPRCTSSLHRDMMPCCHGAYACGGNL
ncbi:MAG: hypothetical protein IPK16_28275 [Anaerolineales bacterium]|nr:hypothetical protein [Anaerolineales bacterium]